MDHEPLFEPGIVGTDLKTLEAVCVEQFEENGVRKRLFNRFTVYVEQLSRVGTRFVVWIDGSFATSKNDPGDIDIIVWFNPAEIDLLPGPSQKLLVNLVSDRNVVRLRYGIDVYCAPEGDIQKRMYWRGCYGFVKETEAPKGIPQIVVEAKDESDCLA